jgi:predicted O-methyltransferase YrrM
MNDPQPEWVAVDRFVTDLIVRPAAALSAALEANRAANLPAIDVSPPQGKLLRILGEMIQARRILEMGTLGGYSTIWLAQALPADGKLISLEYEPKHADVARSNIERAGLSGVVDIRVGKALDLLHKLEVETPDAFDIVFIDADKVSTIDYFNWALPRVRRGGLIIVDNVVRNGALVDGDSADANVQAMRRFCAVLATTPGVVATIIQTVGTKGYDGFAIAVVTGDTTRADKPAVDLPE